MEKFSRFSFTQKWVKDIIVGLLGGITKNLEIMHKNFHMLTTNYPHKSIKTGLTHALQVKIL
jgi:hypothetical protein